jgi:hypothetical protein
LVQKITRRKSFFMASKKIYVYADWLGLNGTVLIGTLRAKSHSCKVVPYG